MKKLGYILLGLTLATTFIPHSYGAGSSGSTPVAPTTPAVSPASLTKDEVAKHNKSNDCWSIVDGNVYDLTNWVYSHPGGSSRIISICGKDGSSSFSGQHSNSSSAKSRLKGFELGKLEVESKAATPNTSTPSTKQLSAFLNEADTLLKQKNFSAASSLLTQADSTYPNNADINNLLGFSSRNLKQYSQSAKYYQKALKINPNHLGALEYQGELFIQTKKIAAAKKNLAKLQQLCGANCPEYQDLKKAIGKR